MSDQPRNRRVERRHGAYKRSHHVVLSVADRPVAFAHVLRFDRDREPVRVYSQGPRPTIARLEEPIRPRGVFPADVPVKLTIKANSIMRGDLRSRCRKPCVSSLDGAVHRVDNNRDWRTIASALPEVWGPDD